MNRLPLLILFAASAAVAQEASNIRNDAPPRQTFQVPLKIAKGTIQSMGVVSPIKADASGQLRAILPGDLEARIERTPAPLPGVVVSIPNAEPRSLVLVQDQATVVELKRSVGEWSSVPYVIGYNRRERGGEVSERLFWRPAYDARGRLKLPNCEIGLTVLDFSGDGVFDRRDYGQATTIGLDVNGDGILFGVNEYRRLEEIIDVCGLPLQVTELDPKGLSITFRISDLTVPTVGAPVPSFSVTTTQGQLIRSSDFRRKVHILDFWASWCAPCVAKLVAVGSLAREHPGEITVIGINVDVPESRSAAEQLIREKALSFPQVMREQGEEDFLWKMFGSMQDVRLSIPLYVVIDEHGIIRYAASGGEDLVGLKSLVQELLSPTSK